MRVNLTSSKDPSQALAAGIGLVLLSAALSGCASVFTVKTDPVEADIHVVDSKGEKKSLGKGPLQMTTADLNAVLGDEVASGEYFTVEVSKAGYTAERFLVPAARFGTLVTSLDVKLTAGKDQRLAKDILEHLFLAQKLANSGQFERAQIELDKVLAGAPDFSRALSMRGSIYYVQKNYAESLKWYEAALAADPRMEDAVQMTARIRAIQKGDKKP